MDIKILPHMGGCIPSSHRLKSGGAFLRFSREDDGALNSYIPMKSTYNPAIYGKSLEGQGVAQPCQKNQPNGSPVGNPQMDLQDQGVIDNECSRHTTGNMSYLTHYEEIDGGYVAFGGNPKEEIITVKCTIKTGHLNFKTMNKLVYGNLLRGLPSKLFENDQTCVACQKGKQHRASFVTDDYSRFTWVFFLATKDETSGILKDSGPDWLLIIDAQTRIMNNEPIIASIQSNGFADTKANPKSSHDDGSKPSSDDGKKVDEDPRKDSECNDQEKEDNVNSTNNVNAASTNEINAIDDKDDGAKDDMKNLDTTIQVSPIPTTRIHKDHPLDQVIRDLQSATQTRRMSKNLEEHGKNPKRNKKDERGIVIRNKALLNGFEDLDFPDRVYKVEKALYGLHQAPRAWYETLSTYLLDNKFQRGTIDKTLFIKRYKGDILLVQVYVDDIIFGSTKKELCFAFEKLMHEKIQMSSMGELTFFLGLQVKQKKDGIFISQDKYVDEILKKFRFTEVKTASTPMETQKPLLKDEDVEEVDVHMYSSMIGSLMCLTSSRPDIMFAVCACARYQVNPKVSHLHVVKRIFRYLKGQPKLGLWYPKDSPFDLVAYTDSDYAGASLDRKSTTGGCQFLGCRLISWQCKKQTVVANSTTEAEYVAASSCCRQVLWI
ncbi:putative ribonuclease H-like domain-containing protein [Tanacetum coccineum]